MKIKAMLSIALGVGVMSISHFASAGWVAGSCPPTASPCIESTTSAGTFYFNGGHADEWHGAPTGGGNLSFSGPSFLGCDGLDLNCTLTLTGQVKKCQDANGDWHLGIRAMSFNTSGSILCNAVSLGGFPWYSKDATITPHCPFGDVCENFNPHTPINNPYIFNMGLIDITVLGVDRVIDGHVHDVEFHHGFGNTYFKFNSPFYDCDENELGCFVDGELEYNGDKSTNHIIIQ